MSNILRELLAAEEPLFDKSIDQLEQATHRHGVDTKLVGEIYFKAAEAMRKLGLDPKDTTGPELYHALIAKIQEHDLHLAKQIGGSNNYDVQTLLPLIKKTIERLKIPRSCWVLKKSVAKEMLRKTPPPNIMKLLKCRSVDSMLKRENLYEIYGALRFAESPEWLNKFDEHYKKLTPSDFETREIEIVVMPKDRWGDIAATFVKKKRHNITHLKELGVVLMLPIKLEKLPGITISALPLLLHYINEIRLYSSFFKLQQVKKNFGEILVETLIADPDLGPIMAGRSIHWRIIQRYFGKLENEDHPEIFEPHLQPEDLHWRHAEEILYQIDPELEFWQGLDYVGLMFEDRPVSFNIMDVSFACNNKTPYAKRVIFHFRESLWNEIFARYMGMHNLREQVLKKLANNMVAPASLT
jgi:hypothetical protein